jgi:hypothetical protein
MGLSQDPITLSINFFLKKIGFVLVEISTKTDESENYISYKTSLGIVSVQVFQFILEAKPE